MYIKFTLFFLSLGLCSLSFGQSKYGFKLGITQSKIDESLASSYQNMNYKTGVQIGVMADINLIKNLNLRPSLQLTQKGYKAVEGNIEGPFYWDRNSSTSYFEIPVDVVYNFPISKASKFFVGAGPVVGIGLFGKGKYVIKGTDGAGQLHTQESSGNQSFKEPGYKRIDFGADFLTGIQIKSILVTASYNHGLMNILN
ncbi:MAG TPA: porin family protein, partial [Lacibacter sp.]|nr:porin family protein [Lacibacter sp.]